MSPSTGTAEHRTGACARRAGRRRHRARLTWPARAIASLMTCSAYSVAPTMNRFGGQPAGRLPRPHPAATRGVCSTITAAARNRDPLGTEPRATGRRVSAQRLTNTDGRAQRETLRPSWPRWGSSPSLPDESVTGPARAASGSAPARPPAPAGSGRPQRCPRAAARRTPRRSPPIVTRGRARPPSTMRKDERAQPPGSGSRAHAEPVVVAAWGPRREAASSRARTVVHLLA